MNCCNLSSLKVSNAPVCNQHCHPHRLLWLPVIKPSASAGERLFSETLLYLIYTTG